MKKFTVLGIAILFSAILFSACDDGGSSSDDSSDDYYADRYEISILNQTEDRLYISYKLRDTSSYSVQTYNKVVSEKGGFCLLEDCYGVSVCDSNYNILYTCSLVPLESTGYYILSFNGYDAKYYFDEDTVLYTPYVSSGKSTITNNSDETLYFCYKTLSSSSSYTNYSLEPNTIWYINPYPYYLHLCICDSGYNRIYSYPTESKTFDISFKGYETMTYKDFE